MDYFKTNWENCKEKWVQYLRMDCVHLGNNTNNRIESAWGKMKMNVNYKMPLDVTVGEILVDALLKEAEYVTKVQESDLRSKLDYNMDFEMDRVNDIATAFASSQIFDQYSYATKVSYVTSYVALVTSYVALVAFLSCCVAAVRRMTRSMKYLTTDRTLSTQGTVTHYCILATTCWTRKHGIARAHSTTI